MGYDAFAAKGYATTSRETASGKQIEIKVFASITARMASADPEKPGGFAELAEAMHDNVRLWNTLAVDVLDEDNQLSPELRVQVIELAQFTFLHTQKVLKREADVEVLVDINRAVTAGLSGVVPDEEAIEAA